VNSAVKNIVFWVVMAVTAVLIWAVVKNSAGGNVQDLSFSTFIDQINNSNVH